MTRYQAILDQITYKDGWTFVLGNNDELMTIALPVPDVTDQSKMVTIRVFIDLPRKLSKKDFIHTVFSAIREIEEHECQEFFMVNGAAPYDPHEVPVPESAANMALENFKKEYLQRII